jgi:hypothetical protein
MEEIKKVTKVEALERFIDRIIDDSQKLAYDKEMGTCTYRHEWGGGCAIGCLLPREIAASLPNVSISDCDVQPLVENYLEDSHSSFWVELQMAHDSLACENYSVFEARLIAAAQMCN